MIDNDKILTAILELSSAILDRAEPLLSECVDDVEVFTMVSRGIDRSLMTIVKLHDQVRAWLEGGMDDDEPEYLSFVTGMEDVHDYVNEEELL